MRAEETTRNGADAKRNRNQRKKEDEEEENLVSRSTRCLVVPSENGTGYGKRDDVTRRRKPGIHWIARAATVVPGILPDKSGNTGLPTAATWRHFRYHRASQDGKTDHECQRETGCEHRMFVDFRFAFSTGRWDFRDVPERSHCQGRFEPETSRTEGCRDEVPLVKTNAPQMVGKLAEYCFSDRPGVGCEVGRL